MNERWTKLLEVPSRTLFSKLISTVRRSWTCSFMFCSCFVRSWMIFTVFVSTVHPHTNERNKPLLVVHRSSSFMFGRTNVRSSELCIGFDVDNFRIHMGDVMDQEITTVRCPIIFSFCDITILRFTFYTQNDENGNFISMASVFHQNLIIDSDSAHFFKLLCLFRYFLTFPHFGIFRSPGTEKSKNHTLLKYKKKTRNISQQLSYSLICSGSSLVWISTAL